LKSQSVIYALQEFTPVKYFSIDRVFRNETLDATHLAEFHQIEGLVADHNLTLGDLMGMLYEFFSKMGNGSIMCAYMCTYLFFVRFEHSFVPSGITNLRFKPAYNPYTEPSMEVFSYHQGAAKEG